MQTTFLHTSSSNRGYTIYGYAPGTTACVSAGAQDNDLGEYFQGCNLRKRLENQYMKYVTGANGNIRFFNIVFVFPTG